MKPIEVLHRPLLKGPIMTPQSLSNPFTGRITLGSGSATVAVTTASVQSDSLIMLGMEQSTNLPIIAGTVDINSGDATATVSNAAIATDSLVFLQTQQGGVAQTSLANLKSIEVLSLDANFLGIGWSDGAGLSERLTTVSYVVYPADGPPGAIEVKSINDGTDFIIGRIDGRAVARDVDILWQITNTSHH